MSDYKGLKPFQDEPIKDVAPWQKEREEKLNSITHLIKRSFDKNAISRVICIFGAYGSGKTSMINVALSHFDNAQIIPFKPTSYKNESEFAAALFAISLEKLNVEAKGLARLKIKVRIWWRSIKIKNGIYTLIKQLFVLFFRLLVLVVFPAFAAMLVLPEQLERISATVVAMLGGSALVVERLKTALKPGLNLKPDDFIKSLKASSITNDLDTIVHEFKWIAELARSRSTPLVVIIDPIDVGLPMQTAIIIETLRLFDIVKAPCAFVITADDRELLKSAVMVNFINQLNHDCDHTFSEKIQIMVNNYLDRFLVSFRLQQPTREEMDRALKDMLAVSEHTENNG